MQKVQRMGGDKGVQSVHKVKMRGAKGENNRGQSMQKVQTMGAKHGKGTKDGGRKGVQKDGRQRG